MENVARRWSRRYWDPEAFEVVCRTAGTSPAEVEQECRMRSGRLDEIADNGWQPYVWEFARMAEVLDMPMDDLYDEAFPESGR